MCPGYEDTYEATTVINFNTEGEIMVSHSVCITKLSGAEALCSVSGSFAGGDSEHVDESMSGCVTEVCCMTQAVSSSSLHAPSVMYGAATTLLRDRKPAA